MNAKLNPFETDLGKNAANHAPLTPLGFIERTAAVYPQRISVIHGVRRYTWQETYARCRRLASALSKRGIGVGDAVAVMLANTPEMYESHFGVPMTGGVLLSLNTRLDAVRTTIKQAGLEPVMLTKDELKQHDSMVELQQSGVVKTGKKDAAEGMNSIDFRVSGAITSYAELAEGNNLLIAKTKTQIARVGVDYALVDIASGKTLVAKSGLGEYRKENTKFLGLGNSSSADVSLREGALRDAMNKAVEAMILELNKLPFQSNILLVDGGSIVFKAGTRSKLESGARLAVYRPGEELIDPETGRSLGKREKRVGEIKLSSHTNSTVSEGSVAEGSGFVKGDILRLVQ